MGKFISTQLHHFADASEIGYGCVSYIRYEDEEGNIHVSFLMGKSCVTRLKHETIPRLELRAAVLSIDCDMFLKEELDMSIDETYYYTDSMTVLQYLNNRETRYKTFVANRVGKILDHSSEDMWKFVRSEENPEDLSSRGIETDEAEKWKFYHEGSTFLTDPQGLWPSEDFNSFLTDKEEVEVRKVKESTAVEINWEPSVLDKLNQSCSDWQRLVKRVASLNRVKQFLINKCQDRIYFIVLKDPPGRDQ
jgi:hypothetical protein